MWSRACGLAGILLAFLPGAQPHAETVAEFYAGKTVIMVVGASAGGSYDVNARMLAPYLTKHLPGHPAIVVENKTGAGGMSAVNYVVNVAPKDGSVIAAAQRMDAFDSLLGNPGPKYDPLKVRWLGSSATEAGVLAVWHAAPQQTAQDLFSRQLIVGATQAASDTGVYPYALNNVLGTKIKVVTGYGGSTDILLAMERGEVQGIGNWSWSDVLAKRPEWLAQKKMRVLVTLATKRLRQLPDVPTAIELTRNEQQRAVMTLLMQMKDLGRPFYLPPGVPQDRYEAMEAAFMASIRDPGFIEELRKQKREVEAISGADMLALLHHAYALPSAIVQATRDAVKPTPGK